MADTLNIHQRLAKAMATVTYVQKEHKQGMQYTIVSHDAVTGKVRPALLENGIVYYPVDLKHAQNGNRCEVALSVRFMNVDDANDFFDVPSLGYGVDNQDKGPGKAISYAVKYALLKAMGLETGDDADHDSVDHVPAAAPIAANVEPSRMSKAEAHTVFSTLTETLHAFGPEVSVAELSAWAGKQAAEIKRLPADWEREFRSDYVEILNAAKARNTKEAA